MRNRIGLALVGLKQIARLTELGKGVRSIRSRSTMIGCAHNIIIMVFVLILRLTKMSRVRVLFNKFIHSGVCLYCHLFRS